MSENQEKIPAADTEEAIVTEEESTLFSTPKTVARKNSKKNRLAALLIPLCIAVVLGGAVAAAYFGGLFNQPETSDVSEEESTPELPSLVDFSETGVSCIQSIAVKNETGSYSFVPDKDGNMTVKGYEDLPRDASAVENILVQYTAVTPDLEIAKNPTAEQLDACGLTKPAATVSAQYTDGSSLELQFGRLATGSDAGYYAMEKGGDTIWLFREDYFQAIMHDDTYFLGKTLMTAPSPNSDDTVGSAKLKTMTLSGGKRQEDVVMRYVQPDDDASLQMAGKFVLVKPFVHAVDNNVTGDWDSSLCGLYGATVEAIHPTEAELAAFGLDNPRTVVTLNFGIYQSTDADGKTLDFPKWYNEVSYTLKLGNLTDEDTYYALIDDVDMVYTVNAATVPYVDMDYEDLVNKSLFLRYITDLSGINATVNGDPYTIAMKHGSKKDENGNSTATLTATINKAAMEEGNVRALYEQMMSVARVAAAPDDATADGTPALTLALVPLAGEADTTFSFYPYSANRFLCVAGDNDRFLVKASDVQELASRFQSCANIAANSAKTTTAS